MDFTWSTLSLQIGGVRGLYMVHMESTWSLYGVYMDSTQTHKISLNLGESPHRLHVDSIWTPQLHVESMWSPGGIYGGQ